jgi:hypothetical protein
LHGSLTGHFRDSSPFIRHRRLDHTPLYINNNETVSDGCEDSRKDGINGNSDDSKRQIAMVGPMMRNVLNSINSSSDEIGKSNFLFFQ